MNIPVHPLTKKVCDNFIIQPSQALLLCGQVGSGKNALSVHIMQELLSSHNLSSALEHPYIKTISGKTDGIDEIRTLQKFLSLIVPGESHVRRIVYINMLDMMSLEAQNALLKTMEEPPSDTALIVTAQQQKNILPTLRSRMRLINVLPVDINLASIFYENKYSGSKINRSFYMSDGLAELMDALLSADDHHPLVKNIELAKNILKQSRFQRLASVERIIKDKESVPELLLEALYKVLKAGYITSLNKTVQSSEELRRYLDRMSLVQSSLREIENKVQAKLVLSRLFLYL